MKTALCMVALAALTACASTPSRYYSLAPVVPPPQAADGAHAVPGFAIRLAEVRIPGQVDRPQLVVRGDSSTAVNVLNQSLWAAPLADQIRAALAQESAQALGVPDVSFMDAPAQLPVWTVAVQVRRFELMAGVQTILDASWTLERSPSDTSSRNESEPGSATQICRAFIQRPVAGEGVEPMVGSQRTALARLASAIAESISDRQTMSLSHAEIDKGCTYSF